MRMKLKLIGVASAFALLAAPAVAQEKLKVGFITTLSGPAGIIGKHMKDAFELGLEHVDGKIGGMETEIIYLDDQRKPDVAVQGVKQMLQRDKVHFVTGVIWSNVLMAIYKPVTDSETFLISSNAGPSPIAGKACSPWFFTTSWQNDQTPEAMGKYMQDKGINNVYVMAPNYQAGKDMVSGFRRYFKGNIVGEVYTKLGQQDYQAEISQLRAANPEAVFVFYPGGMGVQFVKQYAQAGLKGSLPLYSVYTADGVTLPAQKEAALGIFQTQHWSPDLDNPQNKKFVSTFKEKYGYIPSFYASQSYDLVFLLDDAMKQVNGDTSNKDGIRAAIMDGYPSLKGKFRFNNNHFPIQDFYLREVIQDADGTFTVRIVDKVLEDHGDAYAAECDM